MKLLFTAIFLFSFLLGCNGDNAKNFDGIIRHLSSEKIKIEQNIQDIQNKKKKGEISQNEYDEIRKQYLERQAAFNSLIDQLKVALISDKNPEKIALELESEITKNKQLFQKDKSVGTAAGTVGGVIGGTGILVGGAIGGTGILNEISWFSFLKDIFVPIAKHSIETIVKEYRLAQKERKDQIMKILDDQKWVNFDDVK